MKRNVKEHRYWVTDELFLGEEEVSLREYLKALKVLVKKHNRKAIIRFEKTYLGGMSAIIIDRFIRDPKKRRAIDETARKLPKGGKQKPWIDPNGVEPIPTVLQCPECGKMHVDAPNPEKGWDNPPHKTHQCQFCGNEWRPYPVPTYGIHPRDFYRGATEKKRSKKNASNSRSKRQRRSSTRR